MKLPTTWLTKTLVHTLLFFSLTTLLVNFLLINLFAWLDVMGTNEVVKEMDATEKIWLGVIFGPLIETVLFVLLLGEVSIRLFRWTKFEEVITVLISAGLFGWSHNFGWAYVVLTFAIGLSLITCYLVIRTSNGRFVAFLSVFFIHVLNNSMAALSEYIVKGSL